MTDKEALKPEGIQTVAVAGAGIMGSSIAQILAQKGYTVLLYDIEEQSLERSRNLIDINQKGLVSQGKLTQLQSDHCRGMIEHTLDKSCFAKADFVIEAIPEKMEAKHAFWREISEIVPAHAILTSNTSGLSLTEIALAVKLPGRFVGMHWINPAHLIPLVEVTCAELTEEKAARTVYDFAKQVGKKPIMVQKDAPGFVLNRIQFAVLREALHIVESGIASTEDVDNVLKFGLGMRYAAIGPFETADLGGLDTFYSIALYLFPELSDTKSVSPLLENLVKHGEYGVKSGKGFYDYSDGKDKEALDRRDELLLKLAKCLYS